MSRFRLFPALATLFVALATILPASAQTYPSKPIRLICPFPPGGVADVVSRVMAQKMSEALGQPVVVENRTGASGTIGVDVVVKAPADGYTLLMTTGDFITVPGMMPPMSFDPAKALIPVTMVATAPLVLLGNADAPFKTVKDLIAAAKAAPGKYAFSSPGTGTINHLAAEWLAIEAGTRFLHAPYRGGAPAAVAIANGEVQFGVVTQPSAATHVQSGKARVLGLMTKQKPAFVGDMPTVAETGMPEMDASLFVGLFAPAGTPAAIVTRLNDEVAKILKDEEVRKRLNSVGTEANPLSGKAFADFIAEGAARYARIIQQTGIKPEK